MTGPHAACLRLIRADELSASTAQTAGMIRAAAISGDLTGARSIWMGRTILPPGVSSGDHHHGDSETGIYVASGTSPYRAAHHIVTQKAQPADHSPVPGNVDGVTPSV